MHDAIPDGVLRRDLLAALRTPVGSPIADAEFSDLALRVFEWQFSRISPYAAFCRRRGLTPGNVGHWTDVPAVPTAAFKAVPLHTGPADRVERVFRTSGTTAGVERRGEHHIIDTSIYDAALLPGFAACVLPDGARMQMMSLMPAAAEMTDSSLAWMISAVMDRFGAEGSRSFATLHHGVEYDAVTDELHRSTTTSAVCLLGTSLSFVHLLDHLDANRISFQLTAGSRLMDTGGTKGSGRVFDDGTMRARYLKSFGIPASHVVNEYGMTEMCSQFYDSTLLDATRGASRTRRRIVPPWVRTRAVDPQTLAPLPDGETGILQHFDLANVNSVAAIQTEDLGVIVPGGFHLLGRLPGAVPRGCSIAMDLLLSAVRDRGA